MTRPPLSLRGRHGAALTMLGSVLAACAPAVDVVAVARLEACDGTDNDANGIVDDLDANGDGLCDCLRIGVLGYPGQSGDIDLIRGWLRGRTVPTAILAGRELTPQLLAGFDVVIVQDVRDGSGQGTAGREGIGLGIGREYSTAEVQALVAWVDAGGGLLTLAGYALSSGETTNVNRLLAPFGLGYGSQRILIGDAGPVPVTQWDGAHPIARGVRQVGVDNGYPVSGGTLVAWQPAPGAFDIGRAVEWGRGHAFAWGDEWITYDSQWSTRPDFQVQRLWLNALMWLTASGTCQVAIPE